MTPEFEVDFQLLLISFFNVRTVIIFSIYHIHVILVLLHIKGKQIIHILLYGLRGRGSGVETIY